MASSVIPSNFKKKLVIYDNTNGEEISQSISGATISQFKYIFIATDSGTGSYRASVLVPLAVFTGYGGYYFAQEDANHYVYCKYIDDTHVLVKSVGRRALIYLIG